MLGWLRRTPSETPPASLTARIEELEDQYRRLERRFTRLQGEFSALVRYDSDDDDEEEVA